ncbi:hypothetical protein AVEN_219545-1 [Araneus ventricosus]|uniref:Uncharacterized protein n=1 Tax=Araneus ventricosus TaxID=182803 RepID=A0A4Y2IPU6_ARAVE|nr:hypothetical protein AVEN_99339-1 [Araneus ventricosus]GBM79258.1 hypothetical protein AVEN_106857-1 [Araneus ventricosus]GBM79293.1 hypothetical protein AVEN_219545-1 [Araneus ventricosus]
MKAFNIDFIFQLDFLFGDVLTRFYFLSHLNTFFHRSKSNYETAHPMQSGDVLTRYFGVARSWRNPHDPIRFTGVNHIPRWLHTDLSTLDVDYSNILKEREVMASTKPTIPGFYQFSSMRPYNKTNQEWYDGCPRDHKLYQRDADKITEKAFHTTRMSAQGLGRGQMPYLN